MSKAKRARRVYIHDAGHSWLVRYVERRKFQRHLFAQFDKGMRSLEEVEAWVRAQPSVVLDQIETIR
jgi:hypothetical protein